MTSTAKDTTERAPAHTQGLGEESSVWFQLTPLLKAGIDNPMAHSDANGGALRPRYPHQHCKSAHRDAHRA